jgi:hypothetical protein
VARCRTREEAEAVVEGLDVFHAPNPTRERVQAALDRLAAVGIHQHHPDGILARQVTSRLKDAEQPWV